LKYLLEYFPEIRRQVPDATCAVMSGMQLYGMSAEQDNEQYRGIYQLAEQPGVTLYGPLPKPQMAKVMSESRVLAYPNTFPETFCIAALESQASGLPVVTTRSAGLIERVSDGVNGFLIEGKPGDEAYRSSFIRDTVRLWTDDDLWQSQSDEARATAGPFSYEVLSRLWEEKFMELLAKPIESTLWDPMSVSDQKICVSSDGSPCEISLSRESVIESLQGVLRQCGFSNSAESL
jgi:glycosyltransferase involved in cell wall biosynthesis